MSTVKGGPKSIYIDGLILNLDAANPKSYPGSGTTWSDLTVNGNNGTLVNGPTYSSTNGGNIQLNGGQFINLGNPSQLTVRTNPFSIDCFFYLKNTIPNNATLFSKEQESNPFYQFRCAFENARLYFCISNFDVTDSLYSGGFTLMTPNSLNLNSWYHVCVTRFGTAYNLYINGLIASTASTATIIDHINSFNYLIGARVMADYIQANMATFKHYNKALSAAEVLQNYNATKTRFGL